MTAINSACEILLAEDSAADVTFVREALKEHGITCSLHVLRDGEQAIKFIQSRDIDLKQPCPDLLLLDMHLPKRDGEDILRTLRSTDRCAQTPVIVMTSSASPQVQEAAEKNAVLHYFRKPSSLAEFLRLGIIVKDVLAVRQMRSQDRLDNELTAQD